MARPGLSYHEVAIAAQELTAQGQYPTIERIRALTGTGSSTTIAQHLRTWKTQQEDTRLLCQKENLPDEFIALMKGLWERVLEQAAEKVQAIQQDFDQQLAELTTQTEHLRADNMHWQQQYQEASQECTALSKEKNTLQQDIKQMEKAALILNADHSHALAQLQAKDKQIGELQRLNQQAQANLEHYREAAREQRVVDQQRHEQTVSQLEQTLQQLRHELAVAQGQKHALQNNYEKLQYAHDLLQNQYSELNKEHSESKMQLSALTQQSAQHAHAEQHWYAQCINLQAKTDEQQSTMLALQKQTAILSEQLAASQRELLTLANEHKVLTQEKWSLSQEKAHLEGQLKTVTSLQKQMETA